MSLNFWPFRRTIELYAFRPAFDSIAERPLATDENLARYRRLGYNIRVVEPPTPLQPYRNKAEIEVYLTTRKLTEPIVLGYLRRPYKMEDEIAYDKLTDRLYKDMDRWVNEVFLPEAKKIDPSVTAVSRTSRIVVTAKAKDLTIFRSTYQRMYRSADILAQNLNPFDGDK